MSGAITLQRVDRVRPMDQTLPAVVLAGQHQHLVEGIGGQRHGDRESEWVMIVRWSRSAASLLAKMQGGGAAADHQDVVWLDQLHRRRGDTARARSTISLSRSASAGSKEIGRMAPP